MFLKILKHSPSEPYLIKVVSNTTSAYRASCNVTIHLRFWKEMKHLLLLGINKYDDDGSDQIPWVIFSSYIVKKKRNEDENSKFHICLHRHDPNKAIIRDPCYY